MRNWMIWKAILPVAVLLALPNAVEAQKIRICVFFCTEEVDPPVVVSDFCENYRPVVRAPGDTKGLALEPRRRVLGNDLVHFCLCPVRKVNHPRCVGKEF